MEEDQEELEEAVPEEGASSDEPEAAETEVAAVPDLDPEIEEEIKKALVPGELDEQGDVPKAKTHQIPQALIDSELTADDLFDEGSI